MQHVSMSAQYFYYLFIILLLFIGFNHFKLTIMQEGLFNQNREESYATFQTLAMLNGLKSSYLRLECCFGA